MNENVENQCFTCKHIFTTKSNLNQHLKNKKNPCGTIKEIVKHICDNCKKEFSSKRCLDNHKKKKKPCTPIHITLTEENEQLKNRITAITNNNNNITKNSNNQTTNNQYNIYINSNDIENYTDDLNTFSYKQIDKILQHVNIKENEQLQLLNIDKDHSRDFILDNTEEISELFKILYTNFKYKPCIIFRLDETNFSDIYVKTDINDISKLDNNKLIYIIYETFNVLINNYSNNINQQLKKYYKKFIDEYNDGLFEDLTKEHVTNFIKDIKKKLKNNLTSLYEDLTFIYKKNIKKLNNKDDNYTEYLKNKNEIVKNNNIIQPKLNYFNKRYEQQDINDLNNIIASFNEYNEIRLFSIHFKKDKYYIFALCQFFLNKYYFQYKELASIKMISNIIYQFIDNEWCKIPISEFAESFVKNIINELKLRYVKYDEKLNIYTKNDMLYESEAYAKSYYDDLEYLLTTEIPIDFIIKYLLKYKSFIEYKKPNKSIVVV